MKELGDKKKIHHLELGKYINNHKIDFVFGIGKEIQNTINAINNSQIYSRYFKNKFFLINFLKLELKKGDSIYLKASRSMCFEDIVEQL